MKKKTRLSSGSAARSAVCGKTSSPPRSLVSGHCFGRLLSMISRTKKRATENTICVGVGWHGAPEGPPLGRASRSQREDAGEHMAAQQLGPSVCGQVPPSSCWVRPICSHIRDSTAHRYHMSAHLSQPHGRAQLRADPVCWRLAFTVFFFGWLARRS